MRPLIRPCGPPSPLRGEGNHKQKEFDCTMKNTEKTMEQIVTLCKGRGFIFSGSEIYGGLANTWDYGPLGVELKNNVKKAWWKKFVQENPYAPPHPALRATFPPEGGR